MALDFLTAEEKQMMTDDASDMIDDEQLQTVVTYKTFVSRGTFSATTGQVSETYTNSTVNTVRFPLAEAEIRNSGGAYQKGDYRYVLKTADVATPKKDDRILEGSVTRYPFDWSTDPLNIFHTIIARKL